jgi:hypothetical protein
MNTYFIRLDDAAYKVVGDKMFLDGSYLYVYAGEELRGMFRAERIVDARITKEAVG